MQSLLVKLSTIIVLIVVPYNLFAQDNEQGIYVGNTKEVTTVVDSIKSDERIVVLKDDKGKLYPLTIGEDITDFDEIELGDKVRLEYAETFEMSVADTSEKLKDNISAEIQDTDSIKEFTTGKDVFVDISVIDKIDLENRIVTLKDKDGEEMSLQVDNSVKGLDKLRIGDKIKTVYTRTISISLEKH